MALIVETGAGVPGADSYVSRAALLAYLISRDLALPAGMSDEEIDAALRRGTDAVDYLYGGKWLGVRLTAVQELDWPRRGVTVDGVRLPASPLPRYLVQAVCEASWREAGSPGSLAPDTDSSARVVAESVGPLSVTYAGPTSGETAGKPSASFTSIERLLGRLTTTGSQASAGGSSHYLSRA